MGRGTEDAVSLDGEPLQFTPAGVARGCAVPWQQASSRPQSGKFRGGASSRALATMKAAGLRSPPPPRRLPRSERPPSTAAGKIPLAPIEFSPPNVPMDYEDELVEDPEPVSAGRSHGWVEGSASRSSSASSRSSGRERSPVAARPGGGPSSLERMNSRLTAKNDAKRKSTYYTQSAKKPSKDAAGRGARKSVISLVEVELSLPQVDVEQLPITDSRSMRFNAVMGGVILLNIINLTLQVNASNADDALADTAILDVTRRAEYFFVFLFTCEAINRLRCEGGCRMLKVGWNAFDFFCLLVAYLDIATAFIEATIAGKDAAASVDGEKSDSFFSQLSGLRMMRLFRFLRLIRLVKALYAIMLAFVNSFKSLIWTFVLMAVLIWGSAIMMKEGIGNSQCCFDSVPYLKEERFGTIGNAAFTLLQVMTLDAWCSGVAYPVVKEKPHYAIFFVLFVCVSSFGLMNMLVAVIVDSVNKVNSASQREERAQANTRNVKTLQVIFKAFKDPNDEDMSVVAFAKCCKSEGVMHFLHDMAEESGGVFPDTTEVEELFEELDADGSKSVSEEEFVLGMLRCCNSRPIDRLADHVRLRRLEDKIEACMEVFDEELTRIEEKNEAVERLRARLR